MTISQVFTQERVYLEQPEQPALTEITLTPSDVTDLLSGYKGTLISVYSKRKKEIFMVNTNVSSPTTLGDNIAEITYDGIDGYLNSFEFKPDVDGVFKIGIAEFQIVTKTEYDAMVLANDYTLYFNYYPAVYIYAVYDSSTGLYRYFERVANVGVLMNNFAERDLDDFYDILAKSPLVTNQSTIYINFVYKQYSEKTLLPRLTRIVNNSDYEKICIDNCKCGNISEDIQSFYIIQSIYCQRFDVGFSDVYFERLEKIIDMLKAIECCQEEKTKC